MGKKKYIDVEKILKNRSPKTYKFTPKFAINWIKKIIHQDFINDILRRHEGINGQKFLESVLKEFKITIKYNGIENVPKNKKFVFASNHPLGGLDGIVFLNLVHHFFGEVEAVVNDLLLYIENLKPVFTGVNVYGKFTKKQILELNKLFESEKQVIVFPAGLVSRKIKGKITDLKWKKNFLTKAIQYKRDIVPVKAVARNTNFFYNFANIRKFLGFKFNYELIFLPDQMYKFRGKEIHFHFGKPIPYDIYKNEKSINERVKHIRSKADQLNNSNKKLLEFTPTSKIKN